MRHCVLNMLSITLFLLLSSTVNMQTSTLEPASAATKETSKDVLVFKNIKPTNYDESIKVAIPYTHLPSEVEAAMKVINDELKKMNKFNRTEYKNLLLSMCSSNHCKNTGRCFKIGKTRQCACRQYPETDKNGTKKLRVYFRDNCRENKLITIDEDQRSAVATREDHTDYTHLNNIGQLSLIYNRE